MHQAFWGYSFARTQGAYSVHRVTSKNSNVRRPTPQNEGVRFTSPLGEADGRRDTREPLARSHILEADKPSALAGALPGSTRCSWHPPDTPNPGMAGPASPQ